MLTPDKMIILKQKRMELQEIRLVLAGISRNADCDISVTLDQADIKLQHAEQLIQGLLEIKR